MGLYSLVIDVYVYNVYNVYVYAGLCTIEVKKAICPSAFEWVYNTVHKGPVWAAAFSRDGEARLAYELTWAHVHMCTCVCTYMCAIPILMWICLYSCMDACMSACVSEFALSFRLQEASLPLRLQILQ